MIPALAAAPPAAHAANPVTVILLIIGAAAGYAVSLYAWPIRACPRCRGTRVSTGHRTGICRKCAGTGRIRRIGATAVHRFYWSALGNQHHARRRAKIARRRPPAPPDL